MKVNNGNVIKRNIESLNKKSKEHSVIVIDPARRVYTVTSGSSGMRYQVVMFPEDYGGGHCTCDWATKRPLAVQDNGGRVGCSHVLAVEKFIATGSGLTTRVLTDDEEKVKKQKKKTAVVGDGLTVILSKNKKTSRVQSSFLWMVPPKEDNNDYQG